MTLKQETRWLCQNAKRLEKFSGQWVAFHVEEGIVSKGNSLKRILDMTFSKNSRQPFVFHVPSKKELLSPLPIIRKH
ncbi:MAG: DUF5678 domain-containing protein [Elusimicrobiota bacterium]